jgi:hypothetical protein
MLRYGENGRKPLICQSAVDDTACQPWRREAAVRIRFATAQKVATTPAGLNVL